MPDRIYPVPVKPASNISSWSGWPADVVDTLRQWNSGRGVPGRRRASLSFRQTLSGSFFDPSVSVFKCTDCAEFCKPHGHGAAVLGGDWLCDDCLIARARAATALSPKGAAS